MGDEEGVGGFCAEFSRAGGGLLLLAACSIVKAKFGAGTERCCDELAVTIREK